MGRVRGYLGRRVDPLTSLFLVLPLFVAYQLGVLTQMRCSQGACAWDGNGVDFVTANTMAATHGSLLAYGAVTLGVALALGGGILWARRRASLHPRLFVPVVIESALYASLVAPAIALIERGVGLGVRAVEGPLAGVVASCGAGLYEELFFRAGLFAGGLFVLRRVGAKPWIALGVSALVSSVLFSAAHHVGAMGEAFTAQAFVFRVLMGLAFALVYRVRGFAIAAWTHALYDVWVLALH